MIDSLGRHVTYLRLSVIDRCNLRCSYCMSEDVEFLPRDQVLSLEEMARLARVFMDLGVRKIRLTGGEPLVRRNLGWLVEQLGAERAAGRLDELTLTTNGVLLARHADSLAKAGMRRVNVSLDSLDPDEFRRLTRRGEVEPVLDGIRAASQAGLSVKINAVIMPDTPVARIDRLIRWCGREGHDLTLIETMPLGQVAEAAPILAGMREQLDRRWTLVDSDYRSGGPARFVTVAETGRRLGFITPLSHSFCDSCNRLRLSCTGQMVLCLGHETGLDLRAPLRDGAGDGELAALITGALRGKAGGHAFLAPPGLGGPIPIHQLGG